MRGIVGKIFEHRDVRGLRGIGSHQQGVAVGRAARDFLRADAAERAGAVLDHDGLAHGLLQVLTEHPRDLIGAGAGGKRHDDLDLPRWVFVGGIGPRSRQSEQREGCERSQGQFHPFASVVA